VESFDVVIVGAGPTGWPAGIELKRRGVSAVLIDKGCVVNSLYNYPANMVFFTLLSCWRSGDIPMTSLNEKRFESRPSSITGRVAGHINSMFAVERVTACAETMLICHSCRDAERCAKQYASKKVILAMGYYDVPRLEPASHSTTSLECRRSPATQEW